MSNEAFIRLQPGYGRFCELYEAGETQIVWRKSVGDLETPVSAYLKLTNGAENSFLLESVEGGEHLARYSIIGFEPDLIWRAFGERAEIREESGEFAAQAEPALQSLRSLLAMSRIDPPADIAAALPPMFAGVFGFFGYDMVQLTEKLAEPAPNALGLPDAVFLRPTILAVFDNVRQELIFLTPVRPKPGLTAAEAYGEASDRLNAVIDRLKAPVSLPPEPVEPVELNFTSNLTEDGFTSMVESARRYIEAGDIFQVVLSQRYQSPFSAPPFSFYRALRRLNPSPFLFFLNFEGFALAGSSPEILVRVRNGEITVRPIAGTRWRGKTPEADAALAEELLADPKERAEHLMLLDLGRNDAGRCARMGSVTVTDAFQIERYSHVMHIVSQVTARLDNEKYDEVDALFAGFPAGTVSGAPKIRALDIITELEPDSRGPYGGCIGYFSADGNVDSCIALRTALIKDGILTVQAGAGIVADSKASDENLECRNKAGAIFAAADAALKSGRQ